jgi:hypothetical protein
VKSLRSVVFVGNSCRKPPSSAHYQRPIFPSAINTFYEVALPGHGVCPQDPSSRHIIVSGRSTTGLCGHINDKEEEKAEIQRNERYDWCRQKKRSSAAHTICTHRSRQERLGDTTVKKDMVAPTFRMQRVPASMSRLQPVVTYRASRMLRRRLGSWGLPSTTAPAPGVHQANGLGCARLPASRYATVRTDS